MFFFNKKQKAERDEIDRLITLVPPSEEAAQTPDPAKPEDKPDEIPQMPLRAIYRGKEYKAYAKED